MQHELKISMFDLKAILEQLISSEIKINIETYDGKIFEACYVKRVNEDVNVFKFIYGSIECSLGLAEVKCIEFPGFYRYNGESSKIFLVE